MGEKIKTLTDSIFKKSKKNYSISKNDLNPNLKYNSSLTKYNSKYGINGRLELFNSISGQKDMYAIPNDYNFDVELYSLIDQEKHKTLKGHKDVILIIRYFYNKYTNKEYLITSSFDHYIIIWDFNNINPIYLSFKINYNNYAYDCLLIFNQENINNYFLVSSKFLGDYTQKVRLSDGNPLANIDDTNNNETWKLVNWCYNEENFLIEFCNKKIFIYNLNQNKKYAVLQTDEDKDSIYKSGFVYNKDNHNYLCSICVDGRINIWNLNEKSLLKTIRMKGKRLENILKWSNKYAIIADGSEKCFFILDLDKYKTINIIYSRSEDFISCLKKVNHPLYGESLITTFYDDEDIVLWVI